MFGNKIYRIKQPQDDLLAPEETLADSLSVHDTVERPIAYGAFKVVYIILGLVLLLFIAKAFQLQVVQGSQFAALADPRRLQRYSVPALRGLIYDRDGVPLVENVPTFDLLVVQSELTSDLRDEVVGELAQLLDTPVRELSELFEQNDGKALFVVRRNISQERAVTIQSAGLAGIRIIPYARRNYPYDVMMSHVLGYTANITEEELSASATLVPNDRIGRLGIEQSYDDVLRGQSEYVDVDGDIARGFFEPTAGEDVTLTLDADIQEQLYTFTRQVFAEHGIYRGGAVVQNVQSGAVLGIVSFPSFDPNVFEQSGDPEDSEKISRILSDKNKPLFNRIISGLYSPGSTIKPLFALIGLAEGTVTESTLILSEGYIRVQSEVDPNVYYTYRDWKVHGWADIRKAIADSVDVYFYALGGGYGDIKGVGIDTLSRYMSGAFADRQLGIDLPSERSGIVPSRDWKKAVKGEPWYVGDTYNVSIGQGDLSVTPLWINTYIGAIANGGALMKPYVVKEIRGHDGTSLVMESPESLATLPFDTEEFRIVRSGMRQTVTNGTATRLNNLPVHTAAKTGTAQVSGQKLNSLFTVYGPYESPEIVMTVLVEEIPESQSLAVEVANRFLSWYFGDSRTPSVGI